MKGFKFLAVTALVLLVAIAAVAQTTATLTGSATTEGTPLPGVSVTIASPALQGVRTTVTGDNGGYFFGALPPGRYSVTFELEGMQPSSQTVDLGVGQSGRADASLRVSAMSEAITVTASAPAVLDTPQVATNFDADLIEDLPVARTVLGAALLAPGVNDNTPSASQLSISGSPGYDNLVMVNGVPITETIRSQALDLYIEDAIQETTIITGSVSAEYGRFTGGVVNSITKSGGNEFSGSLRDSLTNPSWTEKTPWPTQADPLNNTNHVYEATLGGRIIRDRLWFFGAGRMTETSADFSTRPVPGDTRTFNYVRTTESDRYEVKLTGALTERHNLVASYLDDKAVQQNSVFTTVSYDLDSLADRRDPRDLLSLFYNGILTNNLLVEARYSEMNWGVANGNGSKFTDVIRGTIVRNRADGNARFNSPTFCGVCDEETRSNDGWGLKGSYFLSSSGLGNHNIVGGYEQFSEHRYANNYQSGSNFRLFVNSVQRIGDVLYPTISPGPGGSATYFAWTPIFVGANENDLQTDSFFLNDKWDLNQNFSFNIGARFDKNNAVDGNGVTVSDDSKVSPRLTATWDVNGDGRHRVQASYNEYVSRIVEGPGTAGQSTGSPAYIEYAYLGPAINAPGTPESELLTTHEALQVVFDWFQSQGGTDNLSLLRAGGFRDVPGYSALVAEGLTSPFVSEVVLGYGTQLGNNAYFKIDGIMRDWQEFYAYRLDQSTPRSTDPLGIQHDVAVVVNTNDIEREYRGVQLQSAWRPSRFNLGLNYTWSTLEGNDEQESATSGTVGNSPGNIYYPELLNYARRQPVGDLNQDQTHRLRTWVGYDIPVPPAFGSLNVSLLHNFDSGLSYSAVGSADLPTLTGSNYISAPGSAQYFFSDRGAFRLDDVHRTDLALNFAIPVWRASLFAQGEVLNVFDNDTVIAVNTSTLHAVNATGFATFDPGISSGLVECPQGTARAQCTAMGAHWQKGASFGTPTGPTSYQTPITYRVSVGLRF